MSETILFLHIGRTAGTTLNTILLRNFSDEERYFIDSNDINASVDEYCRLSPDKQAQKRLIYGHFRYGLHEVVPGKSAYITILRDPTERVLSAYDYIVRRRDHRLHDEVRNLDFAGFLRSALTTEVDNGQVRAITNTSTLPYGELDDAILELARRNLSHFAVVGITEYFDESLVELALRFGWRRLTYAPRNAATARTRWSDLTSSEKRLLEERTLFDRAVYEDQLTILRSATDNNGFAVALGRLRRANRIAALPQHVRARIHDSASRLLHERDLGAALARPSRRL